MFWWHNWIHNFSNLSWVLCKNWMKPKMEESVLVFVCIFTCLNWIGDRHQGPSVDWVRTQLRCLVFSVAILKRENIWSELFGRYIRSASGDMWRSLWSWFFMITPLLIPTQVIQRLVDHLSQRTLTQIQLCMGYGPLGRISYPQLPNGFYWQLRLFQSSVHFKATLQGQAFRKLVAMRRPFLRNSVQGTSWRALRQMSMVWPIWLVMGWWCSCLAVACLPLLFRPCFHFLAINLDFLYSDDLPHRLDLFLSRKQEDYVEQNREAVAQLNDEVLESIEGIRVMRAYSKRDQQVKQFQKKTASLSKTGDKIASIQYSFGSLALLFIGFSTILLLLFGGQSLASGQLSLGKLLVLQLYLVF